jgi:hypothetical protein
VASTLRVDPTRLRSAAQAQSDVGAFVSGMCAGRTIADGAGAMPGLESGAACQYASTVLDAAAAQMSAELAAHAKNLISAAERYAKVDEDLGRRLRSIAE